MAIARLIDEMVASQSVAVDTVAGATNSSKAVIAAVTQAIEAAGLNVEDYMGPVDTAVQATEDMSCDVVIVGAGGAGMVAALQAVEDGAQSVVLLEKMGATGGNTVRSTGGMNAAGTPEQAVMEFTESAGVEKNPGERQGGLRPGAGPAHPDGGAAVRRLSGSAPGGLLRQRGAV